LYKQKYVNQDTETQYNSTQPSGLMRNHSVVGKHNMPAAHAFDKNEQPKRLKKYASESDSWMATDNDWDTGDDTGTHGKYNMSRNTASVGTKTDVDPYELSMRNLHIHGAAGIDKGVDDDTLEERAAKHEFDFVHNFGKADIVYTDSESASDYDGVDIMNGINANYDAFLDSYRGDIVDEHGMGNIDDNQPPKNTYNDRLQSSTSHSTNYDGHGNNTSTISQSIYNARSHMLLKKEYDDSITNLVESKHTLDGLIATGSGADVIATQQKHVDEMTRIAKDVSNRLSERERERNKYFKPERE
jgi:hypothetical protein